MSQLDLLGEDEVEFSASSSTVLILRLQITSKWVWVAHKNKS